MNVLMEIIPVMTTPFVLIQLAPLPVNVMLISVEMDPAVKVRADPDFDLCLPFVS